MPQYEFACLVCQKSMVILLETGARLDYRRLRCEWCGEKHLRLNTFVRDASHMISALQQQIRNLQHRIDVLENGTEDSDDDGIKQ